MLVVQGLSCERGGRTVIDSLTFRVEAGGALLLRGANGAGKTTLLRTLAGFLAPLAGTIEIKRPASTAHADVIHYFGHTSGVKTRLSVIENVNFWQRYYNGAISADTVENALDSFGILHLADYSASHLSAGLSRRLGLARLLAAHRPVWLLDEPSASLDSSSATMLETAIASHRSSGGIAVVSTHGGLTIDGARVLQLGPLPAPVNP